MLWRRPAVVAPIRPLARELPNAMGEALKSKTQQFFFFLLFRAASMAYGDSQARVPIRDVAAGHSHTRSETHL